MMSRCRAASAAASALKPSLIALREQPADAKAYSLAGVVVNCAAPRGNDVIPVVLRWRGQGILRADESLISLSIEAGGI